MTNNIKHNIVILVFLLTMPLYSYATPLILTVSTTNDSGAGSLRQAILEANSDPLIPHIIVFSIGSGVQTIQPTSALPAITASYTLIDGTTQPGWSSGSPQIVLDGSLLEPYTLDGLTLRGVHNCLIRGLVINGGFNNGILITDNGTSSNKNVITDCFIGIDQTGTSIRPNNNGITLIGSVNSSNNNNVIGGTLSSQKNVISGNINYGVNIFTNVNSTTIQNNFIGTDLLGTSALPNTIGGISVTGSLIPLPTEQCIGTTIMSNLISGNTFGGILLFANAVQSLIQNNLIGVDTTGTTALPNGSGIVAEGQTDGAVQKTLIIGSNIISGNTSCGIVLATNTVDSVIENNYIGTDITGTINLGNGENGILIQGALTLPCTNNKIGEKNVIAFNGVGSPDHDGVILKGNTITPNLLNQILGNSIFNNQANGITLQNNSNNTQLPPTILNALLNADGNGIIIAALAPSTPFNAFFRLDFFINNADRSPITEGRLFLGSISSVPAGTSIARFFALSTPQLSNVWVSATATNLNNPGSRPGDTSPYCANFQTQILPNSIPSIVFQ